MPVQSVSKLQKAESSFGDAAGLHSFCLKGVRCYDWAKGKPLTGRDLERQAPKRSATEGRRGALRGLPETPVADGGLPLFQQPRPKALLRGPKRGRASVVGLLRPDGS